MRHGSSSIARGGGHLRRDARCGAFTLVEVILAIAIATGLLVIALTFYQQATELRGQILVESERISVIRLVSDRLTADLRQAHPVAGDAESFVGGSGSDRFPRPIPRHCCSTWALPIHHGRRASRQPQEACRVSRWHSPGRQRPSSFGTGWLGSWRTWWWPTTGLGWHRRPR